MPEPSQTPRLAPGAQHAWRPAAALFGSAALGVALAAAGAEHLPAPGAPVTAWDQSERAEHRSVTRAIRRSLVGDGSLSFVAKNVLIVTTDDGTVTLRGLVRSGSERRAVVLTARDLAGASRVVDHLQVAPD